MGNVVESKMIVVRSRGFITTSRGQVTTPITRAFRETCSNIWNMITREKAAVYEVFPDKTELRLSEQNFNTNNSEYVKYMKSLNKTATTFDAPSGKSAAYQEPQSATEKATESFKNQSVLTHADAQKPEAPVKASAPTGQKPAPQEMWNRGKKNKNKHYDNRTNNDSNAAEEPVKDLSVGMESV